MVASCYMFRIKKIGNNTAHSEETGIAYLCRHVFSNNQKILRSANHKPSSVPPYGGDDHLSRTAVTDGL